MLATLVASVLSGEASEALGRTRRALIIYAVAALLGLVGAGFLLGAAFAVLARRIGSIEAALWFGGGALALAAIILVVHRIVSGIRARRVARRRRTEMTAVASAAALATLPALLAGRGRGIALLAPAIAAIAYAVWRENEKPGDGDHDD